ncbi:MAG: FAD-dependent oxidoreductase [Legionellales bacterium]|nr:FAD-dependent oxidoreductase [Legionellales bacterium]
MINDFHWSVIGAGPAGLAAVGQLLDAGIQPQQVAWIDPTFRVGDFGTRWKHVVSNTPCSSFIKYYQAFGSFSFHARAKPFMIEKIASENVCPLLLAAEPLQWITHLLQNQVFSFSDTAVTLKLAQTGWKIHLKSGKMLTTQKIILAIGAEPNVLPFPQLSTISLKDALDINQLQTKISPEDVIAVFGAYLSARNVSENLAKTGVKSIIHFYRSERLFQQHVGSLDLKASVESYLITSSNLLANIPRCNKAIYAVGFSRRDINIEGLPTDFLYDNQNGMIASGIYGLGIAFPEVIPFTNGRLEYKVSAIYPMMKHLKKCFPLWLV